MGTTQHPAARILSLVAVIAAFSSQWATAQTAPPGQAVAAAPISAGEAQRIVHETWTFKDGAPESPMSFAQTADGYLWVGAPAGLFRFDGVRFEPFHSPFGDPLQATNVSALFAGGDRLWIGYVFGGFSYLRNGRVRNFVADSGTVTGFATDAHGITWATTFSATGQSGLWRFDGSSWQQIGVDWNTPRLSGAQVGFDREGTLWVLSGNRAPESPKQLYFLVPGEQQFRNAGSNLFVSSFTWDADNHVVTTRDAGQNDLRSSSELEHSLPAYPILKEQSDQILDRANGIWFIPNKGGMVLRHPAGKPLDQIISTASPGDSEVMQIDPMEHARLVDRDGSIWFGTEAGVHRYSYSPLIQQELPNGPAPYFALAPDEGGAVWISAGGGAGTSSLYRVTDGKVDLQRSMAGVSSFAYRAPDKTLWFGGEGGLWQLANGRFTQVELPKALLGQGRSLITMTHDASGGFWVSFVGRGLYRLRDGEWTKYEDERESRAAGARTACPRSGVVTAFTDSQARVWFGCTKNRVAVLDAGDRTFGPGDGVQVGNVTAIHGRGTDIWIGGELGLQQYNQGRFRTIRAIDSEALQGISGIVETANGDLWLNGLGGIVHIRRAEILEGLKYPAYQVSAERYDRRSGLPGLPSQLGRGPTAIEGTDGRLWFPVTNGVVSLDPARASIRISPPPVSIQSVSADDVVHGPDEHATFPAGTSNIQIGYSAVSLSNPEATRFRYKLQEMDTDWHEAARSTSVNYRNLPPGSYHFEVSARDANGLWSDDKASAAFTILPAYYQTIWFRALFVMLLLLLAWAGYQLRMRRLHLQFEKSLEARVGERTRIARELHDTLLQSFHGLLLRFQAALNHLPDRPGESRQILASAIDQAAEAITEGRDAVQGLRSSATESNDLTDSLRALAEELASENRDQASLLIEVQGMPRALHPIVRDEVFRIAGEALRNAFRHAAANQIELELRYDDRQLRVRVRDDGKGIDSGLLQGEEREGHFGLRGMRERAKLAGGKLTVWSGPDEGTEVELSIPAQHAYSTHSRARSWLARRVSGQSWSSDS